MNLPLLRRLPWPLPALLAWAAAWGFFIIGQRFGLAVGVAWWGSIALSVMAAMLMTKPMRRLMMVIGFPLSWWLIAGGGGSGDLLNHSGWLWLIPLGLLLVLYPIGSWRDAPFFPTSSGAFEGLAEKVPLPRKGLVLDAGCGLGDALLALEQAYPNALLHGLERSWPLRWFCAWRVPQAKVRQGNFWLADWSPYSMVYLFQRPETMERAWAKARLEVRPGAWLASLNFEVPGVLPTETWICPDGRTLWLYQIPRN